MPTEIGIGERARQRLQVFERGALAQERRRARQAGQLGGIGALDIDAPAGPKNVPTYVIGIFR